MGVCYWGQIYPKLLFLIYTSHWPRVLTFRWRGKVFSADDAPINFLRFPALSAFYSSLEKHVGLRGPFPFVSETALSPLLHRSPGEAGDPQLMNSGNYARLLSKRGHKQITDLHHFCICWLTCRDANNCCDLNRSAICLIVVGDTVTRYTVCLLTLLPSYSWWAMSRTLNIRT